MAFSTPKIGQIEHHVPDAGAEGILDLRVMPMARLAHGGRWRVEAMRSYSRPTLLWFTRGQGRITVAGSTRGYGPHNLIYLPPGTMHGFELSSQVFGQAVMFPQGLDIGLPLDPLHLRFRDSHVQAELNVLIEALQRESERNLPGRDRALQHHAGLLAVWIERQVMAEGALEVPIDASRRLAAAYTSLVEEGYRSGKSVGDYARALGVTPTHLTRACRNASGRPASSLLADRIHFEARRLLVETRRPVKEIADTLGFTSAAYFTRAFQKQTGKTPSAFRRDG